MSVGNMHIKELPVEVKQLTRIGPKVSYLVKTIAKPQGVSLSRLLDQAILLCFGLLVGPVSPVESGKTKPGSNNGCPSKQHISEDPTAAISA